MPHKQRPDPVAVTIHHVLMALAFYLKQSRGKDVALLFNPTKNDLKLFASLDDAVAHPGHPAAVNLIQNMMSAKLRARLGGCWMYLTCAPSKADLGMFIQGPSTTDPKGEARLFYPHGEQVRECKPTKDKPSANTTTAIYQQPRSVKFGMKFTALAAAWLGLESPSEGVVRMGGMNAQDTLKLQALEDKDAARIHQLLAQKLKLVGDIQWFPFAVGTSAVKNELYNGWTQPVAAKGAGFRYSEYSHTAKELFDAILMLTAYSLASPLGKVASAKSDDSVSVKVGAVLADPTGSVLSWGVDFSSIFHAEVSCIKLYQKVSKENRKDSLSHCRLYTSLEPCFMCSGLIDAYASSTDLTVLYGSKDTDFANRYTFLKNHPKIHEQRPTFNYQFDASKGSFADRLDTKAKSLIESTDQKPFAEPKKGFAAKKDAKSAMFQLGREHLNRRLAKASLQLAQVPALLKQLQPELGAKANVNAVVNNNALDVKVNGEIKLEEAQALLAVWTGAMELLCKVKGTDPKGLLALAGKYIDDTQGKNEFGVKLNKVRDATKWAKKAEQQLALLPS